MRLNLNDLERYEGNIYVEKIERRNKTLMLQDFDYDTESYLNHIRERKRKVESAYIKSIEKSITQQMKKARMNKYN